MLRALNRGLLPRLRASRAAGNPSASTAASRSTPPASARTSATAAASTHPSAAADTTPLPIWAGGDVEAVVHRSLLSMTPVDVTRLSGRLFNAPVRTDLVHRTVIWQLACRRQGTHKTKTRAEVSGSGRKIRPQKGSGRSRQGARTSPIFRGGGRAHGPKPRDYSFPLPLNVRRGALRSAITSKFQCGQLWVVDDVGVPGAKTRELLEACRRLKWRSVLVIDDDDEGVAGVDKTLRRASHVLQPVLAMNAQGLNVYDALSFDMLVLSRRALARLEERFARYDQLA